MEPHDKILQAIRSGENWTESPYLFPDKRIPLHVRMVSCGFETRRDPSYSFHGLNRGRSEFAIFQYTVAGEGLLDYEGRSFRLLPGDAFLVHLPHNHCYRFDPKSTAGFWSHFYCSFNGREAIRIQRIVEAENGPLLHLAEQSDTVRAGLRLIDTIRSNPQSINFFRSSSLVYDFLMSLCRDSLLSSDSNAEKRSPEFLRSVQIYCMEHLADPSAGVDGMAAAPVTTNIILHVSSGTVSAFHLVNFCATCDSVPLSACFSLNFTTSRKFPISAVSPMKVIFADPSKRNSENRPAFFKIQNYRIFP